MVRGCVHHGRSPRPLPAIGRCPVATSNKQKSEGWAFPDPPPFHKYLLFAGVVELDVAASQLATGRIAVRQLDREGIISARLTVILHYHFVREAVLTIDLGCAVNFAGIRAQDHVVCHAGAMHLRAIGAMIDVLQMAPEAAVVLDSATNSKVALGS